MTFLAGVINERPLIPWIGTTFRFFALGSKAYWKNSIVTVLMLCSNHRCFPILHKLADVTPINKKRHEIVKRRL